MEFIKQKPIYMQIADLLLENVLSGQLKAGDKIQSVREMAAAVQVNPNTVMRAFTYLQEQDIIFNRRGIGYFIAEDAYDQTLHIKKKVFKEQYLPQFFKMLDLLKMDLSELSDLRPNGVHKDP
ncbi:MAG: GntR family transcriptional regulator [Bacteroidota bacterium]